jgi:hypothetical protein
MLTIAGGILLACVALFAASLVLGGALALLNKVVFPKTR